MRALRSNKCIFRTASRCFAGLLSILMAVTPVAGQSAEEQTSPSTSSRATKASSAGTKAGGKKPSAKSHKKPSRKVTASQAARAARTARIHQAFVASTELRPMAQQLANLRTPEAYAGVTAYARKHSGDAAATAYLALGHAYLADKRYGEAEQSLRQARQAGEELADYADFLGAQASHEAGNEPVAETLLNGFASRYPDSIFDAQAPELEATVLLAMNNAAGAQRVLAQVSGPSTARTGFQLVFGEVELKLGQTAGAERTFKQLLLGHPLTQDAEIARARLTEMGAEASLTPAELRSLGDAYYNAGRSSEAAEQYSALLRAPALSASERASVQVAEVACELKLKHLTTAQVQALPDTADENGARRLDLLMELARDRDDTAEQQRVVALMEQRFPASPWLAEALFSSGNMYLLKRDYPTAIEYYSYLAEHFPGSKNAAAAHWKAGWLELPPGALPRSRAAVRRADQAVSLGNRDRVCALLARTPVRNPGPCSIAGGCQLSRHYSRLPALLLRADGALAARRTRQHPADAGSAA